MNKYNEAVEVYESIEEHYLSIDTILKAKNIERILEYFYIYSDKIDIELLMIII